jgi:hypothetical protein
MKYLPFLFAFIFGFQSDAQIIGNVQNEKGEPLAFVNIYIEGTYTGTASNPEGNYELNVMKPGSFIIVFKYLGYKTLKKELHPERYPYTLSVTLTEEEITLEEIVIEAQENPADAIIRNTIANRKRFLSKTQSYRADFYSRGLIRIKNAPETILGQDIGDLGGGLDSTRSGIIYLSETISKIEFKRPDNLKEKIKASKVSGNDNGFSFNNASDVDYNFYNNTVELGNQIVSPIADYAFNYYRYAFEGVFYDDLGNLINKIRVIPKRENDRVFSGTIYIVDEQWSIYALEMDITGQQAQLPGADIISLKQSYSYSKEDALWALLSQSIDFRFGIFGIKGDGRFTAVYSAYDFNPDFPPDNFTNEVLSFDRAANKKDSIYWSAIRPVPLTKEETNDYMIKDSIQVIRKSKTYLDSIDTHRNTFKIPDIVFGYNYVNSFKNWNIGFGSLLTNINFNTVQGYNGTLNINFMKNYDEYRRYLNSTATFNYGIADKRLRPMASITYKFNHFSRPYLSLSGGVTTQQFNENDPILPLINSVSSLFFEDNYMKLYDKSFAQISYSQEWVNGLRFFARIGYERRSPLFNNTGQVFFNGNDYYTSNNPLGETAHGLAGFDTHNILKLDLMARLRFGQKYISYPNRKSILTNPKFPTVHLHYEKGFGAEDRRYNFDQLKVRLTQEFNIGNKGYLAYNFSAGTFFNGDDIAFMDFQHFNANQTHIGRSENYTDVFNNLPYYELSTNASYMEFHAEHDFKGYVLGKVPFINKLNYNLVLGFHALSTENNAPYTEYSLGIDNLGWNKFRFLRLDYVRSYQGGYKGDAVIFGLKFLDFID